MQPQRPQHEAVDELGGILRAAMSTDEHALPELIMPVPEEHALRQFEIQALRQITDNLGRLNDGMTKLNDSVQGVDRRLIRIESNKVEPELAQLRKDVDELRAEKFRRDGALGLAQWFFRNWPAVIGYVGLILAFLAATGKLG